MSNLKRYTLYILNLIDVFSIVLAHFFAYLMRTKILVSFISFHERTDYTKNLLFALVSYIIYNIAVQYNENHFLERNRWEELHSTLKMTLYVTGLPLLYLYVTKQSELFSRIYIGVFIAALIVIDLIARILVKRFVIPRYKTSGNVEDVLVVTDMESAEAAIARLKDDNDWRYLISGLVITDKPLKGQSVAGIKVLSDREHMFEDIESAEIDSVLIVTGDEKRSTIKEWMKRFRDAGKIVHVEVSEYDLDDSFHDIDQMGNTAVVTYRQISPMPKRQILVRRLLNIIAGLLLLPVYLLVTVIVWIFTSIESPGSLLVPRVRVGRNNRRFYKYRYRVYRTDAQERIRNGQSPYTGIGKFLEKTHLDGLPVILNILSGEMTLLGPKARDLQSYLEMNPARRNTMIYPGAIGYWSCDPDPESVFEQEQEFIEHWSLLKDVKIILSTILRYITGNSLRVISEYHRNEELQFAQQLLMQKKPMEYDHSVYTKTKDLRYRIYLSFKRLFDILLSLTAILILSPVFIILTILVVADDGGNPFYAHQRIGLEGRRINVYKFRSMRKDAGDLEKLLTPEQLEQYQKEFKIDNDPRITRVGEFIRKASLDELPQLFNILGGSLSVIGPRPIVEKETKIYGKDVAKLLSVKPGLTGYWQAYARNNATYDTGERQAMEMYYVDHQSLLLDIRIFFHTFISVLKQDGAE